MDDEPPVEPDLNALARGVRDVKKDIASIRTTDFWALCGTICAVALGLAGLLH